MPEEISVPPVAVHTSPALADVLGRMADRHDCRVLDLGGAVPRNIELLAGFARHVRVVDVFRALEELRESADEEVSPDGLIDPRWGPFDLVLAWDVLNYLDPRDGRDLVTAIADLCPTGAILLALILSGPDMAARPTIYTVVENDALEYRYETTARSLCPRLKPANLERILGPFRVERSFVLRHGVQEYVALKGSDE
jgi:hypothetical protein